MQIYLNTNFFRIAQPNTNVALQCQLAKSAFQIIYFTEMIWLWKLFLNLMKLKMRKRIC